MSVSFSQGQVIEGRYQLLSRLGAGGVGSVWLAKDHTRKITVAVKVLRSAVKNRTEMLGLFEQEAELSARMMSPNIVRVLARGVDGSGSPYIVYEALEGEDLATRITRKTRLDLVETETIIVHGARALARAHAVGVVHRDVKPANMFLTRDEAGRLLVKVLDFGVAEMIAKTAASDLSGTVEYMAPEILLEGKPPGARSDLYSLAVVAYRSLCGALPFTGDALGALMVAISTTKPPLASAVVGAPGAELLDAWFARALALDPEQRFATARDLAESFHGAIKQAKALAPLLAVPTPEDQPPPSLLKRTLPDSTETVVLKQEAKPSSARKAAPPAPHRAPVAARPPPPMRPRAQSFVFDEDPGTFTEPAASSSSASTSSRMDVVEVDGRVPGKDDR